MVIAANKLVGAATLVMLLAKPELTSAAGAETAPAAEPPATARPKSAAPLPPPPPPPRAGTPFRLALTYTHVLGESGDRDLVNDQLGTNALGLVFVSPSTTYVRDHFAIAHQWESSGGYSARGFRIDLVSFGYPIRIVERPDWRIDVEPIVTAIRGEIMFVNNDGGRFLRLESGLGLELSATFRGWFLAVQPLAIDFRYWFYGSDAFQPQSRTGLGRIFPLRLAIGHEF
ncbi:MAG TPA: hypothetical protein VIU64_23295 [Polyangia bacterium]